MCSSTASSNLSGSAANIWEDWVKGPLGSRATEFQQTLINKVIGCVFLWPPCYLLIARSICLRSFTHCFSVVVVGVVSLCISLLCTILPGTLIAVSCVVTYFGPWIGLSYWKKHPRLKLVIFKLSMQKMWGIKYALNQITVSFFGVCGGPLVGMFILGGITRKSTWQVIWAITSAVISMIVIGHFLSICFMFDTGCSYWWGNFVCIPCLAYYWITNLQNTELWYGASTCFYWWL